MHHVQGQERDQLTLFPEALEDYIAKENPVRFVDAYVDGLDLKGLGFRHALLEETGRPPYHPADLLKLYVYGYLNRIRSSRQLEKEAGRNLETMWLLKRLTPDFKTIADFRRDNRRAIRRVCWEFILFCRQLDLFGGELVAIDGSKFKAQNAKGRNFTQSKLKRQMKELEKKVDEYLEELDEADEGEKDLPDKPNADQLREKIEAMKRRQAELRQLEEQRKQGGQWQVAVTALGLLSRMAERAKRALGVDEMDVIADKGYYDGQEVKACLEEDITPYIPKANTSANRKRGPVPQGALPH